VRKREERESEGRRKRDAMIKRQRQRQRERERGREGEREREPSMNVSLPTSSFGNSHFPFPSVLSRTHMPKIPLLVPYKICRLKISVSRYERNHYNCGSVFSRENSMKKIYKYIYISPLSPMVIQTNITFEREENTHTHKHTLTH